MRIGNITSSEIVALTSNPTAKAKADGAIFGKPALTYIKQCKWERNLGRSLDTKTSTRPMAWGKLLEIFYFQNLGKVEYTPLMDEPIGHINIKDWYGSPDAINNSLDAVSELKCPYTLTSFCELVEPIYNGLTGMDAMNYIRDKHTDGEKYYWQCVSNAILTGKDVAELIIFMPYKSQLQELRELAEMQDSEVQKDYYFVGSGSDEELPHLVDGGYYKSENSIVFEVPKEDIQFIESRVKLASEILNSK